jgi:TRAP-type C4-dicarboxylate transport system substrate-binding protein
MDETKKELASAERRNFLKLATTGSFTAALVAGAGGMLWSDQAAAQTAAEERDREAAAEHIMTLATAYVLGASRSYPIMQLDLKENIQNATNGKVYVKLAPGGQLGAGGALAQAVQGGTIQCAQHSLSNFAPFASAVDLINLPYFCGSNQRFTNLTSSDAWKSEVHPKIEASGFKALFYIVIDPRVVAVRQGGNAVITPGDMSGVKFRVPGSAMLQQYYSHGRRQPDAGGLGRDALGDQAGRGRRARPVGRRALCLRLQGHPQPRHLHAGRAGQSGLLDQPRVVQQPAVRRAGRHRVRR